MQEVLTEKQLNRIEFEVDSILESIESNEIDSTDYSNSDLTYFKLSALEARVSKSLKTSIRNKLKLIS